MNIKKILILIFLLFLINRKYLLNLLSIIMNKNKYINVIHISYALDNNNFYPTLVSITSALENAKNFSYYNFYILISRNKTKFTNKNKRNFKNLEKIYKNCKFFIIPINDKLFKYAKIIRYPVATYYRLLLAELLPKVNKIIYLDGDTLILSDLTEMYNLKMNNTIVMGFLDSSYELAERFNIKTFKYITAGVILINLELMRKENITEKLFKFMKKNTKLLRQEDQTIINIGLHGRIGFLPPKYGMWTFKNKKQLLFHNHYRKKNYKLACYKESELIEAYKNPGIIHYVYQKPYKYKNYLLKTKFVIQWLYYAKKTKHFEKIIKYYNFDFNNISNLP